MKISRQTLENIARSSNFRIEILEKVIMLTSLLELLFRDDLISKNFTLKGGTALNLFYFDLPRLSVDIDLNYIGSESADTTKKERKLLESRILTLLQDNNYQVQSQPKDHAGGKYRLKYESSVSKLGTIELDINYLLRVPLWDPVQLDSCKLGDFFANDITVLDMHEIAGGKFAALFDRCTSRDIFDAVQILNDNRFNESKLRLAFVIYGAQSRKDWRDLSIDDLIIEDREFSNMLVPMVRISDMKGFLSAKTFLANCKDSLTKLLPLRNNEIEFLNQLLEYGKINPALITDDTALQDRIQRNPALKWKSLNVINYKNISSFD